MDSVIQFVQKAVLKVGFIPTLLIVFFLGMFFFWREAMQTRKNRNSIFDVYLLISLLMLIWGRVMYVISAAAEYKNLIWFISPYERYSDGIYFFRLLPWRYFRIWDGGVMYIPMFVAFLIVGFVVTYFIKKWRWREILGSIYLTGTMMLGLTLFASGLFGGNDEIYREGIVLLIVSILYLFAQAGLKNIFSRLRERLDKYLFVLAYIYSLLVSLYIYYVFKAPSEIDQNHIVALIVFTAISTLIFIVDMRKKTIDIEDITVPGIRTPTTNQPIKIKDNKKAK